MKDNITCSAACLPACLNNKNEIKLLVQRHSQVATCTWPNKHVCPAIVGSHPCVAEQLHNPHHSKYSPQLNNQPCAFGTYIQNRKKTWVLLLAYLWSALAPAVNAGRSAKSHHTPPPPCPPVQMVTRSSHHDHDYEINIVIMSLTSCLCTTSALLVFSLFSWCCALLGGMVCKWAGAGIQDCINRTQLCSTWSPDWTLVLVGLPCCLFWLLEEISPSGAYSSWISKGGERLATGWVVPSIMVCDQPLNGRLYQWSTSLSKTRMCVHQHHTIKSSRLL